MQPASNMHALCCDVLYLSSSKKSIFFSFVDKKRKIMMVWHSIREKNIFWWINPRQEANSAKYPRSKVSYDVFVDLISRMNGISHHEQEGLLFDSLFEIFELFLLWRCSLLRQKQILYNNHTEDPSKLPT